MGLRLGELRPGTGAFLPTHKLRRPVSIDDIRHTGATFVEDGKTVLVWAFCSKVAALAKTADDLSSTGGLGELLANLFFL